MTPSLFPLFCVRHGLTTTSPSGEVVYPTLSPRGASIFAHYQSWLNRREGGTELALERIAADLAGASGIDAKFTKPQRTELRL